MINGGTFVIPKENVTFYTPVRETKTMKTTKQSAAIDFVNENVEVKFKNDTRIMSASQVVSIFNRQREEYFSEEGEDIVIEAPKTSVMYDNRNGKFYIYLPCDKNISQSGQIIFNTSIYEVRDPESDNEYLIHLGDSKKNHYVWTIEDNMYVCNPMNNKKIKDYYLDAASKNIYNYGEVISEQIIVGLLEDYNSYYDYDLFNQLPLVYDLFQEEDKINKNPVRLSDVVLG